MSKIGRLPIIVPEGVNISVQDNIVSVNGTKGQATYTIPQGIRVSLKDSKVLLELDEIGSVTKALYGLTRANLANVIKGMHVGFEKKLELHGVGYRAQMQGTDLVLSLGFSHPVKFRPDSSIKITVAENIITVTGTNKALVGLMADKIRSVKPPEPYKGKGIRYKGEQVKKKAGKAAKAVGGK